MQVVIDSCCATFAEVQKRGENFWAEFELFAADLLVGVVVDIALVGMLAPYARIGQRPVSRGLLGQMQRAYSSLPSRLISHDTFYDEIFSTLISSRLVVPCVTFFYILFSSCCCMLDKVS